MIPQAADGVDPRLTGEELGSLKVIEAAVRGVPQVTDVAVILRGAARPVGAKSGVSDSPELRRASLGYPLVDPEVAGPSIVWGGDLCCSESVPRTLWEALESVAQMATGRGITYVRAGGSDDHQSYAELLSDARRVLSSLHGLGLGPGDCVLFQLRCTRNFITAFWACLLGGFVPTPVSVAPQYTADNAVTRKLHNSWELLEHPPVITDDDQYVAVRSLAELWGVDELRVAMVGELTGSQDTFRHHGRPDDVVLNLMTSGSSGVPKCVQHTNGSLLARIWATAATNGFGPDDVGLNWMPLDHVGGIVMWHLRDVVLGCRQVIADLETFLGRPTVLLDWIHRYRATNTWAPNFAFALINKHDTEIAQGSWDLSSMRHICNGGEAVIADVAHRFLRLLAPHGLARDAMYPSWGMSETSSGVTFSRLDRDDASVGTVCVDARSLGGQLRVTPVDSPSAVVFSEVGPPIPGVGLRIVDADGAVVPEGMMGSLQVRGSTMMSGYFRNPQVNREAFTADGWFRTGDLGFLQEGRLTITGREKDVVIVGGANYVNSEIEPVIERVEGVRVTYAAACALPDFHSRIDQLGVFFTPASENPRDWPVVVREIRTQLSREVGLVPSIVVPVPRHQFPKTNSGKIQRIQLVRDLEAGNFDEHLQRLAGAQTREVSNPRFHTVTWQPTVTDAALVELPANPWLVVGGRGGDGRLATTLAGRLPDRLVELAVTGGDALTTALANRPTVVVYAAGLPAGSRDLDVAGLRGTVGEVVLSLLRLIQALSPGPYPEIIVVTTRAVWARAGDEVDCAKTALLGLVRTARAEAIPIRHVDVPVGQADAWADILIGEARRCGSDPVVAYRDGIRLTPRLRSVVPDIGTRPAIEAGGRYLLTGGLGGIGFELAQYLLSAYQTRLLILGRTPLSAGGETHQRYLRLCALGEVRYSAVDVADTDAVSAAVKEAEAQWAGPLTGVLHLAGADVSGLWDDLERHRLASESTEEFWRMFRSKVFGTWALRDLLAERPDTPLMLFSSVNGYFGGTSFGAYAAASSFLDGFADHWGRQLGRSVRSLAWSAWADVGMNRASPAAVAAAQRGFRTITAEEGLVSFLAALRVDEVHVLVGLDPTAPGVRAELDPRELGSTEVIVAYTASTSLPGGAVEQAIAAASVDAVVRCVRVAALPREPGGGIHRSRLDVELTRADRGDRVIEQPATDLERQLTDIWEHVLSTAPIGRHETFFELGGTSLTAAELVATINRVLHTRLPTRTLYEYPTVAGIAETLAWTPGNHDDNPF
jgi:acyl-CoA synthetase (AMP-forming)/AMP-acid ligase II/NAD(P)-dependent dehydrogenase (short-subunit alcohol dehydrogenase family)